MSTCEVGHNCGSIPGLCRAHSGAILITEFSIPNQSEIHVTETLFQPLFQFRLPFSNSFLPTSYPHPTPCMHLCQDHGLVGYTFSWVVNGLPSRRKPDKKSSTDDSSTNKSHMFQACSQAGTWMEGLKSSQPPFHSTCARFIGNRFHLAFFIGSTKKMQQSILPHSFGGDGLFFPNLWVCLVSSSDTQPCAPHREKSYIDTHCPPSYFCTAVTAN